MIGLILLVYLAVCAHALTIIPEFPHKHKGFRYSLLFQDTKADFATAKKICQRYGAQLVSFHGADEVEFVKQVERSNLTWMEDTWMGLTVTVTPTGFVYKWVDGTRFDFKNFAPGEPRRLESGQYCAQIIYANETEHFGKWKIVSCSDQLQPYTCKKPLDGTSWGTPAPSDEDDDFPHRFKQNQYAVEYDPNKVKFVEARIKCQNMNADLASLHSRDEVEFLKRIMQSNSTLMEDAWIGMVYTISATSAEKKWTDGSPFDYKNFAPGMPNSFSVGEHCGQVMSDGENLGKWKTTDCSDDAHIYVCKKPWIPPSVPSGDPMFPHVFKDSKFGIFNDKVTFIQARMKCEEMGAELASIHSKREIEFLKGVMQSRSVYMEDSWIGMIHTVTHTGATSRWVDSTPFDFKNFAPNEPKYQKYGDLCGQMMSNGDELSKWRVVDCTDTAYAYVCKKPKNGRGGGRGRTVIPNNPDPGSQEDGPTPRPDPSKDGFPYRFKGDKYAVNYDPNKVKFVEARVRCQNMNGELASFHSKDEIDFVKSIMQSNSTVMEDAWIGLVYDVTATGTNTKWLDGSRYDFTNYAIGEPKYDGTGQFCGQIVTNGAEFSKWKVVDCSSDAYVYVCKKTKSDNNNGGGKTKKPKVPQVVTPAPEPENPTVATPPDSKDDPFIHQFEDDKYAIQYDPNKVTFLQARMKCEEMDGELASIHSNEEVEFLKCVLRSNSTLMEDSWIGLVYDVTNNDADNKWVDGSRFNFSNYADGEPRYVGMGEFCVQMITNGDEFGKWKVVNCRDSTYVYVCKKRKEDPGNDPNEPRTTSKIGSSEEDPNNKPRPSSKRVKTRRPRQTKPTPTPEMFLPEDYTTTESYPDATQPPHCNPATADPDDPSCKPISEYDPIVEEKGCYPV